ncbi:MAG: hypothetical protein HY298_10800 [Verrucomicrobia bacterium]|nr:hypothetical protein [Verrucomicrobiota bacterium]
MHQIENLLKRTIGLDAESIGSTSISQTVRLRMQHHQLTKLEDYTKYLQETPAELTALVEAVVVKETWFFRDQESFTALVRLVRSEWLPANTVDPDSECGVDSCQLRVDSSDSRLSTKDSQPVLRLLSLPCSTGEEPYSMAMALLDAGLPAERFQIDAVDISTHALETARRAVYRKNSFRPDSRCRGDYRDRHFRPHEDSYLLSQTVRDQVRFHRGNVLAEHAEGPLNQRHHYDYIFCRNLLIYFDRPTQGKVLQKLERLLQPTGVLFVCPVELPLVIRPVESGELKVDSPNSQPSPLFTSARIPMAAACRKAVESSKLRVESKNAQPSPRGVGGFTPQGETLRSQPRTLSRGQPRQPLSGRKPVAKSKQVESSKSTPTAGVGVNSRTLSRGQLTEAARLANGGRLAEAARICEKLVESLVLRVEGSPPARRQTDLQLGEDSQLSTKDSQPRTLSRGQLSSQLAEAYYLLGLISEAVASDKLTPTAGVGANLQLDDAVEYYRKALYLEPNHYETLVQMATLSGKNGDAHGARLLHKRAQRSLKAKV